MKQKIIMLGVAGMISGTAHIAFGMQKSFTMLNGSLMSFNLSVSDKDPVTNIPFASYLTKRATDGLPPVLALVKEVDPNTKKITGWKLYTPDGINQLRTTGKLKDADLANVHFFLYDEKATSPQGRFLCYGNDVFRAGQLAKEPLTVAYHNLIFEQKNKELLANAALTIKEKNNALYIFLGNFLSKYVIPTASQALQEYKTNEKAPVSAFYIEITKNTSLPTAFDKQDDLNKILVYRDNRGVITGLILYGISNDGKTAIIKEIVAQPYYVTDLLKAFETKVKSIGKSLIFIDTGFPQLPQNIIDILKTLKFVPSKNNAAALGKTL